MGMSSRRGRARRVCRKRSPGIRPLPWPAFVEVMIVPDACVYPMIAPGTSYKDIVTGPHIKARVPKPKEEPKKPQPTDLF